MKFARIVGLTALVVAGLMAFAGSASATTITSPTGTSYTNTIHAVSEGHIVLHGVTTVECESTIEGKIESHGAGVTAAGNLTHFTFTNCTGGIDVTTLKAGSLVIHTDKEQIDSNGTVTWNGGEISVHVTPLEITCIYTSSETHIGTLTGSHTTGGNSILHLETGTKLPRTGGSIFCGSSGELGGTYRVTTPNALYVD